MRSIASRMARIQVMGVTSDSSIQVEHTSAQKDT